MAWPARVRLACAEREWHESRRGGGSRRGKAEAAALSGQRPCLGLSARLRCHGWPVSPRHRRGGLACARGSRPDSALDQEPRTVGRWPGSARSLGIRCHGSIGANRQRLWPPQGCAGRRADVSNTAILEPPKCSAWNSCPKLGSRYGTVRWVPASRWPNKSAAVAWFRFVDTREELILPGPHAERTADTEATRGNQQLDELDDSSGVRAITSRFRHHR